MGMEGAPKEPSNEDIKEAAETMESLDKQEELDAQYGNSPEAEALRNQFAEQIKNAGNAVQEKFLKGEKLTYNEKWELMRSLPKTQEDRKKLSEMLFGKK